MCATSEQRKGICATGLLVAAVAAIGVTGAPVATAAAFPGAHGRGHDGGRWAIGHGPIPPLPSLPPVSAPPGPAHVEGPSAGQSGHGHGPGHGDGHGPALPTPPPVAPPIPVPHGVTPPVRIPHATHGHEHGHASTGRCRTCHIPVLAPAPLTPVSPNPIPVPVPVPVPVTTVPLVVAAPPAQRPTHGRSGGALEPVLPTAPAVPRPTSPVARRRGATSFLSLTVSLQSLTAAVTPAGTGAGAPGARVAGPARGSTLVAGTTPGPSAVHTARSADGQLTPHPIATKPIRSTTDAIQRVERFVPAAVWWALAAAIALAAIAGTAALRSARRVRRQAGQFAAVTAAAMTDSLTGVLNRRGFTEAVERELARARRYGRPFVLAYVDVRGLKRVNDTEGHLAGDALLTDAAHLLRDCARAEDVVGRIGGDEFGLLLNEQNPHGAQTVIERIRAQVPARARAATVRGHWDLTIGTAGYPQDGTTINDLLATADRRLYQQRGIALR
jgi:diguanylate cyclase (GGDEF)-like protein